MPLVTTLSTVNGTLEILDGTPIKLPGFTLTARGVTVVGKPKIQEWQGAMAFASAVHEAAPCWVGQLLNYADTRKDWQAKMDQALGATGLSRQRLKNLAYVTKHVEAHELSLAPSIGHAEEVAALPRPEQTEWLAKARTEGWSTRELRAQIRRARRSVVIEGGAPTMFTVDVTSRHIVEAHTSWEAQEKAWAAVKDALTSLPHAHVIGAQAQK